jgi:hypothetical protein
MSALVTYTVGDREYPLTRSARCHTCRSPHRRTVEILLVGGASCSEAVQDLPDDAGLTSRNVREHVNRGHLPVEHEVVRRLAEEETKGRAEQVEEGVAVRFQAIALASTIVELFTARLLAGELEPTMPDGIRMCKLLARYEQAVRQEKAVRRNQKLAEQLRHSGDALTAVLTLAKAHMAPAGWSDFLAAYGRRRAAPSPRSPR